MSLCLVVFGLIIIGSIGKSNVDGYEYTINARRIVATTRLGGSMAFMEPCFGSACSITYAVSISEDDPYEIGGKVKIDDDHIVYELDRQSAYTVTACDKLDANSWDYVISEVVRKGLTDDDACNIKEGEYVLEEELGPIIVAFESMISCGDYKLKAELNFEGRWVVVGHFEFNIPENDDCTPRTA